MVFFCCNKCGSSLKKAQVEKHVFQCRPVSLSCMDCHKDFRGDEYKGHTKCISEEEKYGGDGFKAPANRNKGEKKQQAWVEIVQATMASAGKFLQPAARNLLEALTKHENVPRKKPKFLNFVRNIGRNRFDEQTLNIVWDLLEKQWKISAEQNKPQQKPKEEAAKKDEVSGSSNSSAEEKVVSTATENGVSEESTERKKKKKKKKGKDDEDVAEEMVQQDGSTNSVGETTIAEEADIPKKKKKKSKKAKDDAVDEPVAEEETKTEKSKSEGQEVGTSNAAQLENGTESAEPKKKKKKSKKHSHEESVLDDSQVGMETEEVSVGLEDVKTKKKKKRKHDESNLSNGGVDMETSVVIVEERNGNADDGEEKKKKKKKRKHEEDAQGDNELENSVIEDVAPKEKHKKSKHSVESNGITLTESNYSSENQQNGESSFNAESIESPEEIKKRLKAERKAARKAAKAAQNGVSAV